MRFAEWFEKAFMVEPMSDRGVVSAGAELLQVDLSPPPKPRLAAVRTAPSRDEFAAWRDEPVTQFVMAALQRNAEECKEHWLAASWSEGTANQRLLDEMRARADALDGFTAGYEAFCETLGLQPEPKPEADDAA